MNRREDWNELLARANEDLQKYNTSIEVEQDDDGYYSVTINGCDFADNNFEDELYDLINDAWANARIKAVKDAEREALKEKLISFRILNGWTHDMPALVWSITSVTLYFHDFDTDGIERVVGSIDAYENRDGEFLVHEDEYDIAEQQIYEHDELGIEH